MTEVQLRTHTYPIEGTASEIWAATEALRRAGELVDWRSMVEVTQNRYRIEVTVRAYPLPRRGRLDLPGVVLVALGSLPFAAAGGYVTGRVGAAIIAQVLAALGSAAAAVFLLYAVATVRHRRPGHHCPGCPDR
jgi:hypothetical protein